MYVYDPCLKTEIKTETEFLKTVNVFTLFWIYYDCISRTKCLGHLFFVLLNILSLVLNGGIVSFLASRFLNVSQHFFCYLLVIVVFVRHRFLKSVFESCFRHHTNIIHHFWTISVISYFQCLLHDLHNTTNKK